MYCTIQDCKVQYSSCCDTHSNPLLIDVALKLATSLSDGNARQ